MASLELRPRASRDLDDILVYVAQDDLDAAIELVLRIQDIIELIGANPQLGRPRPELGVSLRYLHVDRYLIFYSFEDDLVMVERVLHLARDIPAQFE